MNSLLCLIIFTESFTLINRTSISGVQLPHTNPSEKTFHQLYVDLNLRQRFLLGLTSQHLNGNVVFMIKYYGIRKKIDAFRNYTINNPVVAWEKQKYTRIGEFGVY